MKISNRVSIRGGEQRCTFRIVSNGGGAKLSTAASKKSIGVVTTCSPTGIAIRVVLLEYPVVGSGTRVVAQG